jgi:hypothetical protein
MPDSFMADFSLSCVIQPVVSNTTSLYYGDDDAYVTQLKPRGRCMKILNKFTRHQESIMQMEVQRKVLAFWSITVLGLTRKQRERKMIDRGWLARHIVQLAGVTVLVLREIK